MRALLLALALLVNARGADLDNLRATQLRLIAARNNDKLPRDEVPLEVVAIAKHQLLAWAESKLQSFGRDVEPAVLTAVFSRQLQDGLAPRSDDDLDHLGVLDIAFSRAGGEPTWLQMNTDVGIPCGADRSAYLYEWRDNRWNRRFVLEANGDSRTDYDPQNFIELQVSSADSRGVRRVLETGYPPACMSVWHTLYIKLFRIDTKQTLLLEQSPLSNIGEAYSARLEPGGIMVKFAGSSIDSAYLIRPHVLRYNLDHDRAQRIEPIALSPRDFVEEWLTRPWSEISAWSERQVVQWHKKFHKDNLFGSFDAVQRCTKPGERQISINFEDKTAYFSVLDHGDNRFRMLQVRERPRLDCSGRNELEN